MGKQSELVQAMFGERVAKAAFEEQAQTIKEFRNSQRLKINKGAGGVVNLSAIAGLPIPKHTFYGDSEP
jgi:hypothetical protein